MVPALPRRESLDTLPDELLHEIISYGFVRTLRRLPFPTLASVLSKVNHRLRRFALPLVWKYVRVESLARATRLNRLLKEKPVFGTFVRYVVFLSFPIVPRLPSGHSKTRMVNQICLVASSCIIPRETRRARAKTFFRSYRGFKN